MSFVLSYSFGPAFLLVWRRVWPHQSGGCGRTILGGVAGTKGGVAITLLLLLLIINILEHELLKPQSYKVIPRKSCLEPYFGSCHDIMRHCLQLTTMQYHTTVRRHKKS